MKTFATQYSREDGKVDAFRHKDGWILRSIQGPAWFWNHSTKGWDICLDINLRLSSAKVAQYILSEEEALKLLPILDPVS